MPSLVILMIESEQPEGISARKLVIETVKHNVITAYEPDEGLDLLRRFPAIDAIMLHSGVVDGHKHIIDELRALNATAPIIVACPGPDQHFEGADYVVDSHQPGQLLDLLARVFGVSKRTDRL